MENQIGDIKKNIESCKKQGNDQDIIQNLQQLQEIKITIQILLQTKIGRTVNSLKKHKNEEISSLSDTLVAEWKLLMPEKKTEETSPNTQEVKSEPDSTTTNPKKRKLSDPEEPQVNKKADKKKNFTSTGDPVRDTARTAFQAVLACVVLEETEGPSFTAEDIAYRLEDALFEIHKSTNKDYKNKFRSLKFNLKDEKNPALRQKIMEGQLTPEILVTLSPHEMASEELQKERKDSAAWHTEAARIYKPQSTTDQFKCGKCKERKCTFYQLQTRSADEPMTTFVTCTNCGNRWVNSIPVFIHYLT